MANDLKEKTDALEKRAQQVRTLLKYAQRAFVIEFAGTPKSGKTTSIEAVRHFFTRQGFTVHVLTERAAACPIPMKGHLFFNTWCATSMLAELLANVETETDIIIVDRGILDALVWLISQERRGEVTNDEAKTIESFLLLPRWRNLIDLGVVMSVSPEEAMMRENNARITEKPGSVMNPETLQSITESVSTAMDRFGPKFRKVFRHETSKRPLKESLIDLAAGIVDGLEQFLNPEILVVPRQHIAALPLQNGGAFDKDAVKRAVDVVREHGHFMRRDKAEGNFDQVQIIPSGLLEHKHQIFVFLRRDSDPKYRLYGKATILQGTHVSRQEEEDVERRLQAALVEKVSGSLFLSRVFPIEPIGYCWDKDDEISSRHFGIVYRIHIDNDHTAIDLKRKEFRKKRGHNRTGQFQSPEQLVTQEMKVMLESWSHAVLRGLKIEQ